MVEQSAASPQQDSMQPSGSLNQQRESAQFVGFQIDGQQYAFPIELIQEIVILDQVTRTPHVPRFVEGVSNLRGSIIPIINLRVLLGVDPKAADDETRTIVVNVDERTIGCTVDSVSQVIRIPESSVQATPSTITADGANFISGFAKVNDSLVILLDVNNLLEPSKFTPD